MELLSSMLQPCSDVATKNMSRHILEMVSRNEICCGCFIVVATLTAIVDVASLFTRCHDFDMMSRHSPANVVTLDF